MSLITEAELRLDSEKEYEIVNGQPEEKEMAGALHSGVGSRLIIRLGVHSETHKLQRFRVVCSVTTGTRGKN